MRKIESFQVNHLNLKPGLYLSRVDKNGEAEVRTFDVRLTTPNVDTVLDTGTMHTIEHIGATYLRNSKIKDDVIYFGPMGCRTGFYLVLFGAQEPADVFPYVEALFNFIVTFEGDIPGATPKECGNYKDQNLPGAKTAAQNYLTELQHKRFVYPE